MLFTASVIKLSDDHSIANGTVRIVYAFPGQPDLLIKVFHAFEERSSRRPLKRLAWRLFPMLKFRTILNELKCELLASLKLGADIENMPISRMLGIVQTDRGVGVVVERIDGLDGDLAQRLNRLCRRGRMDEPVLEALNVFVGRMFDLHIVARDINFSNIVYGTRGAGAACFLIDGYGERNLIPFRSMSRRMNDRSLDRQFATIARKTGLTWHSDQRAFSNSG
ncbi:hypothetical protein CEP88_15125 [Roseobacter denitrificans]|uniref:PhoP regulatory network protein YrbL n=1 Tax=Roseobacter denitrificans (strain ATCC 33942 / OCh 114) TaxID=375451 RepID=Q16BG7_ROSDO|nr:PhoP regulatory network YrbL family protein [Roseobacter denitrificans]ABG30676.1 hypothetical protein RD1_1011 [Roseobacter denitrificans OCh 114]AVL53802.1 hypothetical protein CEP88_15125 [Roseobacter denitrificans]SFG18612.1 PhoP regulatory network protein YrbL [Roseobacter denitrificans OCh 114]